MRRVVWLRSWAILSLALSAALTSAADTPPDASAGAQYEEPRLTYGMLEETQRWA